MRRLSLGRDGALLFATRVIRLFAYGLLSVVLVIYLRANGLDEARVGLLLTLALAGDTVVSLWLATRADRFGRRRTLVAGALLIILGGTCFALTHDFTLLLVAATIGVISPSGGEVGPFLSIEQSALAETLPAERRTWAFAWYNLAGSFGTALGALVGGTMAAALQRRGLESLESYRAVVFAYALLGVVLALGFAALSSRVEAAAASAPTRSTFMGLHRSRRVVVRLSALFALDAFGGGFVVQSIMAYWFHLRFGVEPALLGAIFFGANLLAGLSSLSAAWVSRRIGLVNTMVFTHLPSNVLLILVPLMPTVHLAIAVLLARFAISQMDVPTRQSYVMAVVDPEERSAAAGLTGVARTVGASLAPMLAAPLLASAALSSVPFFVAGGLKAAYDVALWRSFRKLRPPEESEA